MNGHRSVRTFTFTAALLLALAICLSALAPQPVSAREDNSLSLEQISAQLIEISTSYQVGDVLSDEDAAFVKAHALSANDANLQPRGSASVYETRTAYGTSARLSGTVWHNGSFNYNFGGNLTGTITSGATPRSMTVTVFCQSYGIVGSSTVLTYSDSVSQTSQNSRSVSMSKSKNYSGVAALYMINSQLDVTTSSGNGFTINAS